MHQNNVPVAGAAHNAVFHCLRVPIQPVLGVHRPHGQRSPHRPQGSGSAAAIGEPHHVAGPLAAGPVKHRVGALNLALHPILGEIGQVAVVIAVVGNLVPLLIGPLHHSRVAGRVGPQHKKGCLDSPGLQPIQQLIRIGAGAVVISNRRQLFASIPLSLLHTLRLSGYFFLPLWGGRGLRLSPLVRRLHFRHNRRCLLCSAGGQGKAHCQHSRHQQHRNPSLHFSRLHSSLNCVRIPAQPWA